LVSASPEKNNEAEPENSPETDAKENSDKPAEKEFETEAEGFAGKSVEETQVTKNDSDNKNAREEGGQE
jgi:hypothetical protein